MRRLLLFLALLLWFGLAATITVAWLYASTVDGQYVRNRFVKWSDYARGAYNGWRIRQWSGAGKLGMRIEPFDPDRVPRTFDGTLPAWSTARTRRPRPDEPPLIEDARGWPWLSLRCTWTENDHDFLLPEELIIGGIPIAAFDPPWLRDPPPPVGINFEPDKEFLTMTRIEPCRSCRSGPASWAR